MSLDEKDRQKIIENALSYIVVFAMFAYGFGKIIQFNVANEINSKITDITGMELMWAFYGYSKAYVLTLGIFEITGGFLMLVKRTRILGCFFVTTILVNVILQDIFYEVNIGALRAAILYQFSILIVLWFNRHQLKQTLKILLSSLNGKQENNKRVVILICSLSLFSVLRIVEFYLTIKIW